MDRELSEVGLSAAVSAFHKGPPGVVRSVAHNDSTPPDYEKLPVTYKDGQAAVVDAVAAYLEVVESDEQPDEATAPASRWAEFSDEELVELDEMVSATDESYDLTPLGEKISLELDAEVARRKALRTRSKKTLSMVDVRNWLGRMRSRPAEDNTYRVVDWLCRDLEGRPDLDPNYDSGASR